MNRVDENILIPMGDGFRNGVMAKFFSKRRPGTIIPEACEGNKKAAAVGFEWLDKQMADGRSFVCGERFSLADIRLYMVYSFYSKNDSTMVADAALTNVAAWSARMEGTPGVKACRAVAAKL
eukprot:COSAG05_NODE_9928_length_593_cov_0.722672_1_plen_122_part_00